MDAQTPVQIWLAEIQSALRREKAFRKVGRRVVKLYEAGASSEASAAQTPFNILYSIQFLAMVIIGGIGSIMGSLMGAAFMVLLPELVQSGADMLTGSALDRWLRIGASVSFLREMAIGAAIILFLIFEPDGLAHRWRMIKAYWKLYPYSH